MKYPAYFAPHHASGYYVTFRDISEAHTQGDTKEEAKEMAVDALVTALDFYFEDRRLIPLPSEPIEGEILIALPVDMIARVRSHNRTFNEKERNISTLLKYPLDVETEIELELEISNILWPKVNKVFIGGQWRLQDAKKTRVPKFARENDAAFELIADNQFKVELKNGVYHINGCNYPRPHFIVNESHANRNRRYLRHAVVCAMIAEHEASANEYDESENNHED